MSDGYPSLLRLADVLSQHKDYKVRVTGNTDSVGSAAYNEKLALARANAVKAFLVKYGASDGQIATAGDGKRQPEVDNKTKEGRFINRRVVLSVADGTGKSIGEGTIGQVLPELQAIQDLAKKQEECCTQILKRLDKLDDILAAMKGLQGDNDRLKSEVADLRNQQNALKDQVNGLHPITEPQAQAMITKAEPGIASAAAENVMKQEHDNNHKIANVGINVGPAFGDGRANKSHVTVAARGQFFTPMGADGKFGFQAQGEYMFVPGIQEGQFDAGLVDRVGHFQAGAFSSFKYVNSANMNPAAFSAKPRSWPTISSPRQGRRVRHEGLQDGHVDSPSWAPGAFMQTYARVNDQVGMNFTVAAWGRAYFEGNAGAIFSHVWDNKPGVNVKLVQPIIEHVAFTAEAGLNSTFLNTLNNSSSGDLRFGLLFGGLINPHDYSKITTAVPMEIPRVHYELGTRRVGSSPPIADAGPDQLNIGAQVVTLNGSGSFDPLGETLTYQWTQLAGPAVVITNSTQAKATFQATAGNTYSFRLTVRNTDGLQATDTTTVSVNAPSAVRILQFSANPTSVIPGGTSTLSWVVENATSVTITPVRAPSMRSPAKSPPVR